MMLMSMVASSLVLKWLRIICPYMNEHSGLERSVSPPPDVYRENDAMTHPES